MEKYKNLIRFLVLALVFMASTVQATVAELIDIAGSQRMLTQRILKSYCQIGLKEFYGNPQKQLQDAISRFETQLATIEAGSNDPKVVQALAQVKRLWPEYKDLASKKPSKEGAAQLLSLNPELLAATHAVVLALEESTGTKVAEIVNASGRQRMLSQRMAMFYMLQSWGVEAPSIAHELKKANEEFRATHNRLNELPSNSLSINNALLRVSNSLKLLERTLEYKGENLSFTVAMTTDGMLEAMDEVTAEYALTLGGEAK